MHSGEEGVAPGGAARLGVVVHEDAAFVCDPVDVRCFPDHQAAMIAARLHEADIIAHDEQDIGFLVLRLGSDVTAHVSVANTVRIAQLSSLGFINVFLSVFWVVVR